MARGDADIPYGTLDLMVLKILDAMGPLNGYAVARRIEQIAQGSLALNQGTIYPALLRLEQKGWIPSEWGTSDNNRRARFYAITKAGKKQLAAETESWERTVAIMTRTAPATAGGAAAEAGGTAAASPAAGRGGRRVEGLGEGGSRPGRRSSRRCSTTARCTSIGRASGGRRRPVARRPSASGRPTRTRSPTGGTC